MIISSSICKSQVIITPVDNLTLYSYNWHLFWFPAMDLYNMDWSQVPSMTFQKDSLLIGEGHAGCHSFKFKFSQIKKDKIQFLGFDARLLNCDQDPLRKFVRLLHQTDQFSIKNHELRFYCKGDLIAKFYGSYSDMLQYPNRALNGEWKVVHFSNASAAMQKLINSETVTLTFDEYCSHSISGILDCQSFKGDYIFTGPQKIYFQNLKFESNTNCRAGVDTSFMYGLRIINNYHIGDDVLYLCRNSGALMQLSRVKSAMLTNGSSVRFGEKKKRKTQYSCPVE